MRIKSKKIFAKDGKCIDMITTVLFKSKKKLVFSNKKILEDKKRN